MDPLRGLRNAEASGSRGPGVAGNPARKPRKKPKSSQQSTRQGPIPAPYLATAPLPVSSLSQSRVDELALQSSMVLPSSFTRPSSSSARPPLGPSRHSDGQGRRSKYAAGLLAPPAIMPGGSSSTPRVQGSNVAPQNPRRRSADRTGVGGSIPTLAPVVATTSRNGLDMRQRSSERLRDIGQVNTSVMSLGQLGQIMETDPSTETNGPVADSSLGEQPTGRRRRRVVRAEAGLSRRLTVSTREEGRALGIARGASMRRTNVWDDLPESSDPPPAFPFPTASTNRLPPAFDTNETQRSDPPAATSNGTADGQERPRSPPPTFEQAIGLAPLPAPLTPSANPDPPLDPTDVTTPRARPNLSLQTVEQTIDPSGPPSSVSPIATQYASAPSSPVPSEAAMTERTEEDDVAIIMAREDRRMWNADILAGYTLEERVRRESERRAAAASVSQEQSHEPAKPVGGAGSEISRETQPVQTIKETVLEEHSSREQEDVGAEKEFENGVLSGNVLGVSGAESSTASPSNVTEPSGSSKIDSAKATETVNPPEQLTIPASGQPDKPVSSPPSVSPIEPPTTPPGSTPYMLPPVIVSPFQPTPGFAKAKEMAEQATPVRPTSGKKKHDIGAESNSGSELRKVKVSQEQSQSGAESDQVVSHSPPTRKLTRGKAIRRSSSSNQVTPTRADSVLTQRGNEQKPLFSSPGYTASELEAIPVPTSSRHAHRPSASDVLDIGSKTSPAGSGRPLRERLKSSPNIHVPVEEEQAGASGLPPHREAALRRRESALGRMERRLVKNDSLPAAVQEEDRLASFAQANSSLKPAIRSPVAGPLIDLNEPWPEILTQSPPKDLQTLAATTAEILQLLEDQPIAESSAQAAAKAATIQAVQDMLNQTSGQLPPQAIAPKKKAPPPPPPLKLKPSNGSVKRKPSVLSSADTPITPRPVVPPSQSDKSETRERPSAMPTRRPPPPPPVVAPDTSAVPPALPPRPIPPTFSARPNLAERRLSALSGTDSSVSERGASLVSPPAPEYIRRPRTSLTVRPRGPRPPPVPSRSWSKVVAEAPIDLSPVRPPTDRTLSDPAHAIDTHTPSPPRSISAVDLRSPVRQPGSPEYTDLDVYIARLEGSGREYEGYAHITSFLGPAKNPAASSAALATLLPGPIQVDSRRTNAAGKIKLKLSLLGVRVTKCPICLSQFKGGDKGVMLPLCGHVAHEVCGRRWFRENRNCFVCRVPLAEEGS